MATIFNRGYASPSCISCGPGRTVGSPHFVATPARLEVIQAGDLSRRTMINWQKSAVGTVHINQISKKSAATDRYATRSRILATHGRAVGSTHFIAPDFNPVLVTPDVI